MVDEFLFAGEKQPMYNEAVRNNYCMADFDRWVHLQKLIGEPVSFGTAMMIEDTLWSEDLDVLEINKLEDLMNTPGHVCKNSTEMLVAVFNKDGTVVPNEFDVTDKDIVILAKAFQIPLSHTAEQKPSLSEKIQTASAKSTAASTPSNSISTSIENDR